MKYSHRSVLLQAVKDIPQQDVNKVKLLESLDLLIS